MVLVKHRGFCVSRLVWRDETGRGLGEVLPRRGQGQLLAWRDEVKQGPRWQDLYTLKWDVIVDD